MFGISTVPHLDAPALRAGFQEDNSRVEHSRFRRRVLYGAWLSDVQRRIVARVGPERSRAWGEPDLSANPARTLAAQSAVLYDEGWAISHPDDQQGTAKVLMDLAIKQAALVPKLARLQRDTVGMREGLMRIDVAHDTGRLLARQVFSDLVVGEPTEADPTLLGTLQEARKRKIGATRLWTWEVLDPETRTIRIVTELGDDVTTEVLGARFSGADYPYVNADGAAFLPHVLYHASVTSQLWDPFENFELYDGTLNTAFLWTFWNHCVEDASWPQRYAAGWVPRSVNVDGDSEAPRMASAADPSILLILEPSELNTGQGLIGQWQPGSDPKVLGEAIGDYERRLAAYGGFTAADVHRVSGDPRSGFAMAISREGQIKAAARLKPQFRASDELLLGIIAAQLNRWSEGNGVPLGLPEEGWVVKYLAVPDPEDDPTRPPIPSGVQTDDVDTSAQTSPGRTEDGIVDTDADAGNVARNS